jgi:glutaminyl-tRNA synthetase
LDEIKNSKGAAIMTSNDSVPSAHFIKKIIEDDLETNKYDGRVMTRFPPEPNGYLHIGHAKSICLNFGLAEEYRGLCNLRFDDTNPTKEEVEYVESIQEDVRWLGFDWDDRLYYASDYFEQLYQYAVQLIKDNKAYVDGLSAEEIREYRGTLTEPGKESPHRNRQVEPRKLYLLRLIDFQLLKEPVVQGTVMNSRMALMYSGQKSIWPLEI